MNSEEQQEDLDATTETLENNGPGHLLAKKREALGMSVQDVADTLHITMHYVRALETDEHDKLPGDVFIKGYLRSYAGLLSLDPTVIINVYLDYRGEREKDGSESSTRRGSSFNFGSKRRIPWIVVSGIAFVGMAIALWLFNSGSSSSANQAGRPSNATTSNASTRTLRPGAVASLDEVATSVAVPSIPDQITQSVPSPDLDEQAAIDETQGLADTSAAQDISSSERLITVDGGGEDLVQFTFTGESMVQVTDANDEQIYRELRVAGDLLRINGTAPFNILLGGASNSELSFNGAKVDFSSSIRIDNSARLTIGL
jgi:cytoskeleton protein RodZ